MKLLDIRTFELKSDVHAVFDRIWKELVQVDIGAGQVAIYNALSGEFVTGDLQAFTNAPEMSK